MRKAVLTLFALLVLIPCLECAAQTPSATPPDLAAFLATLSAGQTSTPVASSTLNFQWITCTDDDDCPEGQLCCYPCGIDGCDFMCMNPDRRGRCPIIP
jgi:hypothetical protein